MRKIIKFFVDSEARFRFLSNHGFYTKMSDEEWLKKAWFLKFGKKLNLDDPKTFNEKLQWLKLHDRKDVYTKMVDKYEVKKYVADVIGEECIIPTLGVYNKFDEIDFDKLPDQFVIKCTHDSGGLAIIKDKSKMDLKKIRKKINKCLRRNYFYNGREWPYKNVKPRIIIEKYMEDSKKSAIDYKFFCFNGEPKVLLVCSNRFDEGGLKETWFDIGWNLLPLTEGGHSIDESLRPPKNLKKMKDLARKLAKDMAFVRIDFYEFNGRVYFGEITFSPASGFERFSPKKWDRILGDWLNIEGM